MQLFRLLYAQHTRVYRTAQAQATTICDAHAAPRELRSAPQAPLSSRAATVRVHVISPITPPRQSPTCEIEIVNLGEGGVIGPITPPPSRCAAEALGSASSPRGRGRRCRQGTNPAAQSRTPATCTAHQHNNSWRHVHRRSAGIATRRYTPSPSSFTRVAPPTTTIAVTCS